MTHVSSPFPPLPLRPRAFLKPTISAQPTGPTRPTAWGRDVVSTNEKKKKTGGTAHGRDAASAGAVGTSTSTETAMDVNREKTKSAGNLFRTTRSSFRQTNVTPILSGPSKLG